MSRLERIPSPRRLLEHQAGRSEAARMVGTRGVQVDLGGLRRRVDEATSVLADAGFDGGSPLVLGFANSIEFVVWMMACFGLGGSILPLNGRSRDREIEESLERTGARFIAGAANFPLPGNRGWGPAFSPGAGATLFRKPAAGHDLPSDAAPAGLIHQFTSGTTGTPRHLIRTEAQVHEDYAHFIDHLGIDTGDRFLLIPPLHHSFGLLGLFAGLASGSALHLIDRFVPAEVLRAARTFKPTVVFCTPVMIDMLGRCFLDAGDSSAFASARHIVCSTDRLRKPVHDAFVSRFGVPIRVQYGSTETLSATIDLADDFVEGRVGKPYPGVEVRIFNEIGNIAAPGTVGRVGIRSPAAALRYVDDLAPDIRMLDGHVIPGDRGYIDEAGELHLVGREGILNIGGWKVDPLEISSLISSALAVGHVAVLPFLRAGQPAIRVVIESRDPSLRPDDVISLCRKSLTDYKVPAKVEIFASLPRDENGKVRLADLPS